MYVIKGFAIKSSFANNQPGLTNLFGELSTQSLTYSKEKGIYKNNTIEDIIFVSFTATEDDEKVELPLIISDHVIDVLNFVYKQTTTQPTVEITTSVILQLLSNSYGSTCKDFSCGPIESDGTYYVPQWVQWKLISDDSLFRVWFVNNAFLTQFDDYEIEFVAPFDNLDDFFLAGAVIEQRLKQITTKQIVDKLQLKKGDHPETFIQVETYNYHDPLNSDRVIASDWGFLGYGIVASNIDVIKEELINFILENSTHSREEWAEIFPDIFKRTEFVIAPFWDKFAIEPRTTTPGIYSPFITNNEASERLKALLPTYTQTQIDTYCMISSFPFKSLIIASIGSLENRDNKFQLIDFFPDFINVSSISEDFNRMSQYTQNWSILIHELIVYAEDTNPDTLIPLSISKITRDGILYLSRIYDNVQYLVATKYSIDAL